VNQNPQFKPRRQALCILTEEKQRGNRLVATTALCEPRLAEVDNTTILVLANFFTRVLARRVGVERAQELVTDSLLANG
jgi:hypothetical protein